MTTVLFSAQQVSTQSLSVAAQLGFVAAHKMISIF